MDGEPDLVASVAATKERASSSTPFTEAELESAVRSLGSVAGAQSSLDLAAYRDLLGATAHTSHKDWPRTEAAAEELAAILAGPDDAQFWRIFERVLSDGNWEGALDAAGARREGAKPWVVLITGVNGIRKTSSVQQPWFQKVLGTALGEAYDGPLDELPDGRNSFFRQLDYMIATIACEEFRKLYAVDDVSLYATCKDAIFARYRKLAEMLGVLLMREAQRKGMNLMVETTGKDTAMYKYVDFLFPDGGEYRKLVVHFSINEIEFAERSVDARMQKEMRDGKEALAASAAELIRANAGGAQGSSVLRGIEAESNAVWDAVRSGSGEVGHGWLKASVRIDAAADAPWTASAVPAGATSGAGEAFAFGAPR